MQYVWHLHQVNNYCTTVKSVESVEEDQPSPEDITDGDQTDSHETLRKRPLPEPQQGIDSKLISIHKIK